MELFELMKTITKEVYISDLKNSDASKLLLSVLDLRLFSLRELEDAAEYIYFEQITFSSYEQAFDFFRRKNPAH